MNLQHSHTLSLCTILHYTQVSQLVLVARQCGEDSLSTSQSLALVRHLIGEVDVTTALVAASAVGEKEEGREGEGDFDKHR